MPQRIIKKKSFYFKSSSGSDVVVHIYSQLPERLRQEDGWLQEFKASLETEQRPLYTNKQKMKDSVAMAAHAYNPKIRESGSRTAVNLGLAWLYYNSRPAWNSIQQGPVLKNKFLFLLHFYHSYSNSVMTSGF